MSPFVTPLNPFDFFIDPFFPFFVAGAAFDVEEVPTRVVSVMVVERIGSLTTVLIFLLSAGVSRSGAIWSSFFSSS